MRSMRCCSLALAAASSAASIGWGADRLSSALASSRALGTLRRASLCGAPVSCWPERKAPRARASSRPSLQLGVPLLRSRSSSVGALEEPSTLAGGRRRCRTARTCEMNTVCRGTGGQRTQTDPRCHNGIRPQRESAHRDILPTYAMGDQWLG